MKDRIAIVPLLDRIVPMASCQRHRRFLLAFKASSALVAAALTISLVGSFATVSHVKADEKIWRTEIGTALTIDGRSTAGKTTTGSIEAFIPLVQGNSSVLFVDLRLNPENISDLNGDWGGGIRHIVNKDLMIGAYGYLNSQTVSGRHFIATTLGTEFITPYVDGRINLHAPLTDVKDTGSISTSSLELVGNQLVEAVRLTESRRGALFGIDSEIGLRMPIGIIDGSHIRIGGGAYHYERDGLGTITGGTASLEYSVANLLGAKNTTLYAYGKASYDEVDDFSFTAGARIRVALNTFSGNSNIADQAGIPLGYSHLDSVSRPLTGGVFDRANEFVRGDIGVKTRRINVDRSFNRIAINNLSGSEFGQFFFADGDGAGAGTFVDPTTVDLANNGAGNSDTIVALGGQGNLTTAGLVLANGVSLVGGGTSVSVRLSDGSVQTFLLPGSRGTIQGTSVPNDVVTVTGNNRIENLSITGGADGIAGLNAAASSIRNVAVTNAGQHGFSFAGTSSITGSDLTATGSGIDGLNVTGDGTYNFSGTNSFSGNTDDGVDINGAGTYNFAGILNGGLTGAGNGDRGFDLAGEGTFNFATINAVDNTGTGFKLTSTNGSLTTTGGTISGNGIDGINIDPVNANVVLDSITHSGTGNGVVLDQVTGTFLVKGATTVSGGTGDGIIIQNNNGLTASFQGFVSVSNKTGAGRGLVLANNAGSTVQLADLNISNTGGDAISGTGAGTVTVSGKTTIATPGGDGIDLTGTTGANFSFGDIDITGLGANTGLNLAGGDSTFSAMTLDITGTNQAGSRGIDLSGTQNNRSVSITNGGNISNVSTGTVLGSNGAAGTGANAAFSFGTGTIAGTTFSLDTFGLNQVSGTYGFNATTFTGPFNFGGSDVVFIDSDGAVGGGDGSGSSAANPTTITTADAITTAAATFVILDNGNMVDVNNAAGFTLSDGQSIASFANGRQFTTAGAPANVTGTNIPVGGAIVTGLAVGTLTNSAGNTLVIGNNNTIADLNGQSNSSFVQVNGAAANTTVTGLTLSNIDTAFRLVAASSGTITTTNSSITNSTGIGIDVQGGTASLAFNGLTFNHNANSAAVSFTDHSTGTVTFDGTSNLGITAGTGLQFSNADGVYNFNGTTNLNGGDAGIDILAASNGTFTFSANTSITSPTGIAYNEAASGANTTFNGTITQNNAASAVRVTGKTGGTTNFAGAIVANTSTANGVDLSNLGGGTVNFLAGLDIDTTSGTGFIATNTGTVNVSNSGTETINTTSGTGLSLSAVSISTGLLFDNIDVGDAGAPVNGIVINSTNGAGAITVSTVDLDAATSAAIAIVNSANAININGGTAGTGAGAVAVVDIDQGSANVAIAAALTNVAGRSVDITNRTGGTITLSGNVSDTGTGVNFAGNTGGTTTFSGTNVTLNTGANTALSLATSPGQTVNFTGTTVDIDTTSANAVDVSGGGTINFNSGTTTTTINATSGKGFEADGASTLVVTGNAQVTTTTGIGVDIQNTTIGAGGATFRSVSVNGAANGIVLNNTGTTGAFTIAGDGTSTLGGNSSGGTIQNTTGSGILLTDARNIALNNVSVTGAGLHGLQGTTLANLDIASSTFSNNGNAVNEHGIVVTNLQGTAAGGLTNTFNNLVVSGSNTNNIQIANATATATNTPANPDLIVVSNSTIQNLSAPNGSNGILVTSSAAGNVRLEVSNATIENNRATGLAINGNTGGDVQLSVTGSTFRPGAGSQITGISMGLTGASTGTFDISNNPLINVEVGPSGSPVAIAVSAFDTATFSGTIANNTSIGGNSNVTGIRIIGEGNAGSGGTVDINNNTIISNVTGNNFNFGVQVAARDSSAIDTTIRNNAITITGGVFPAAVSASSGNSDGDTARLCINFVNNTGVAPGVNVYGLEHFTGTTFQLQGYVGAANNEALVEAFVQGTDTGTPNVDAFAGGAGPVNFTAAVCATP